MAQQENDQRKLALIARLDKQRTEVDAAHGGLIRELSLSRQLKLSVSQKPIPWAIGAAGAAGFLALLIRRPRASGVVRRSKIGVLLGLGFTLAKPALAKWALQRFKQEAKQRFTGHPLNSMLGEEP